ncbi:hypothetical protein H9P43_009230 [Blastocladiella emersonii ATCC 22665]|nr:hypothetical protein H9P43_009230 [Blastocladiella emersonii ATCC 22665]
MASNPTTFTISPALCSDISALPGTCSTAAKDPQAVPAARARAAELRQLLAEQFAACSAAIDAAAQPAPSQGNGTSATHPPKLQAQAAKALDALIAAHSRYNNMINLAVDMLPAGAPPAAPAAASPAAPAASTTSVDKQLRADIESTRINFRHPTRGNCRDPATFLHMVIAFYNLVMQPLSQQRNGSAAADYLVVARRWTLGMLQIKTSGTTLSQTRFASVATRGLMVAAVFSMQGMGILTGCLFSTLLLLILKPTLQPVDSTTIYVSNFDNVWRILFFIGVLPAIAAVYWRLQVPETPRFSAAKGDHDTAMKDLSKVMHEIQGSNGGDISVDLEASPASSSEHLALPTTANQAVARLGIGSACC